MRITQLIKTLDSLNGCLGIEEFEVQGISCNSKLVTENSVFVAIKGNREDGNKFIKEAIERGAKVIITQGSSGAGVSRKPGGAFFIRVKDTRRALARLASEFYGNPSSRIKVTGITGTNGKTTTSYLIEALLKKSGSSPGVIGTINYRFKDIVTPAKNTTPGPLELEAMLSQMLKEGVDYAVMEVSSHALDQDRTDGINFHSAIFTNLTQDHLDYHKTQDRYFLAKAKLFSGLGKDAFAVINIDDKYGRKIRALTGARIITYGIDKDSDVSAENIKSGVRSTELRLLTPKGGIKLTMRFIGRHNVYNILAAVAWGVKEGIALPVIKSALEGSPQVPGRLERVDFSGKFSIFVDYAHTENALSNVLKTLRGVSKKRIIVVFGCGGERDRAKRPKMGRVASELSDYAVITNDNPRSEEPRSIIKEIQKGINNANYCIIPERFEAIRKSLSIARPGDIVLIAGKGHENYQILKNKVVDFDDRKVIEECLKSMNC